MPAVYLLTFRYIKICAIWCIPFWKPKGYNFRNRLSPLGHPRHNLATQSRRGLLAEGCPLQLTYRTASLEWPPIRNHGPKHCWRIKLNRASMTEASSIGFRNLKHVETMFHRIPRIYERHWQVMRIWRVTSYIPKRTSDSPFKPKVPDPSIRYNMMATPEFVSWFVWSRVITHTASWNCRYFHHQHLTLKTYLQTCRPKFCQLPGSLRPFIREMIAAQGGRKWLMLLYQIYTLCSWAGGNWNKKGHRFASES